MVREQNSGKKPVQAAQVVFGEANPVISDNDGLFTLRFPRKKAGDWVFLEDVQKSGYELVNKKEIEQVKLSSDERLGVDVILAPAGKLDAARREYYDISDKALLAGFEREKKALRDKLQKSHLNQQQYEEKYEYIQKQYDQQQQQLTQLADKFARVNFDDVSPVYQEALELFKAGHIDQAIAKLESINPAKRTEEIIKEEKRIGEAQKELDAQRAALETEKRQQIANLRLLADMYNADFDPVKAEAQYDQLLRLDSTDLEILWDAANFYKDNHRYEKALYVCPLVIVHPKAEEWQLANAHGYLGELHTTTGNLPAALDAFTKVFRLYEQMHRSEPNHSFYKKNLAISYSKLGSTHTALGNLPQALTFFKKDIELSKELYAAYPQNVDFKNGLAISYEKLGETHTALGNLDQALTFFEDETKLFEELYAAYPQNVEFKNGLAIAYSKLGETHSALGNLEQALTFFEDFSKLMQELYAAYPQNVAFKNGKAISYSKLGETHAALGNLEQALTFFEDFSKLMQELYAAYPQNVAFKNGLAVSYSKLGETFSALGNLELALTFFENYSELSKELYAAYPQNVEFKNGLAISYERLGDTHTALGNLDQALTFFEKDIELSKELYTAYPQNVEFKNGLAISYRNSGNTALGIGPGFDFF